MKRFAFTLSELLIAMTIIGVVAILTVPSVSKNMANKSNIVKIQSTFKLLSDAVVNMRTNEHVSDLIDSSLYSDKATFFANYLKLSKVCGKDYDECFAASYVSLEDEVPEELEAIFSDEGYDSYSAILANGASVLFFTPDNSNYVGSFIFDVNGTEPPNIIGRDLFSFRVLSSGAIQTAYYQPFYDEAARKGQCISGKSYGQPCLQQLQDKDWVMDY